MDFADKTSAEQGYGPRALPPHAFKAGSVPLYDYSPAHKLIDKHRDLQYPYLCKFGSAILEIANGVFCPTLANASRLLLDTVTFTSGERVLDIFSGSGAFGINAALAGATVVTVDISELAVSCTMKNAARNCVEDRIDARRGTMSECVVNDEEFDLIIANPPLLPGDQYDAFSISIFDPDLCTTIEFIQAVARHLTADGRCYLVTSDVIERYGYDVDRICVESGLDSYVAAKLDVGYESYRVHHIVLSRAGVK